MLSAQLLIFYSRLELQRTFFPPTHHDGEVTASLSPGDKRIWTALRMFIELRGGTTLQIPFREASKVFLLFLVCLAHTLQWRRIGNGMERQRFTRDSG